MCHRPCQGRATCNHPCSLVFCHAGECEPCIQLVKRPCYCGKTSKSFKCCEVSGITDKTGFFCCNKVCQKPLKGCRHGCRLQCHEGPCAECEMDVAVKCPCGRQVKHMKCCEVQKLPGYDASCPVQVLLKCNKECEEQSNPKQGEKQQEKAVVPNTTSYWLWVMCLVFAVMSVILGLYVSLSVCYYKNITICNRLTSLRRSIGGRSVSVSIIIR